MRANGTIRKQLTSDQSDSHPRWSPTSNTIVFQRGGGEAKEILTINSDGSGQKVIVKASNGGYVMYPSWSPNGSQIVFVSNSGTVGSSQLRVVNADGTGLTTIAPSVTEASDPVWSPDGKLIAYDTSGIAIYALSDIKVTNLAGTNDTNLTSASGTHNFSPSWQRLGSAPTPAPRPIPVPAPTTTSPSASNCAPYIVIDSRGSGETGGLSPPGSAFVNKFRKLKAPARVSVIPNPYPAVGWTSFLGAVLQLPAGYHESVAAGSTWLRSELSQLGTACPHAKFILTGYSQGAQVAGDVYQRRSYPKVLGVVLFGDPYFNSRDSKVDQGSFVRGLNGNLGTRPVFGATMRGHVRSYCHNHDPVCQGPLSFAELALYRFTRHSNYDDSRLAEPEDAAVYFAGLG